MPRIRFARPIRTALILCLWYAMPGTSQAQSGEFFRSTVTLDKGTVVTQLFNAATFPPPDGTPQKTTDLTLPEVNPAGPRVIRVLLPLDEQRDPKFIIGVPPQQEVLMGGIAHGTLSLVYYRDGTISRDDNPFGRSDSKTADAPAHIDIPAWGRSVNLLRPISKNATHLTITAIVMPDSAAAPGQERQGNIGVIVRDAVVLGTDVTMDEPLTAPVIMKVSPASWRLWHRMAIRAGSGNRLDNVANAPRFDVAVVEQRWSAESGTAPQHRRSARDSLSVGSGTAFEAGDDEQSELFDAFATRNSTERVIRFRRSAVTAGEVG